MAATLTARTALVFAAVSLAVAPVRSARAEPQIPVDLFDHEAPHEFSTWLKGHAAADPDRVFSVDADGVHISGAGDGYLATERQFRNYRLSLEFRWGDQKGLARGDREGKALDSGVFLHATGPHGNSHDGDGAFMAAIECNLFQGASGDVLLIRGDDENGNLIAPRVSVESAPLRDADGFPFWQARGEQVTLERWGRVNWKHKSRAWRDALGFRGAKDIERAYGEWNQIECLCRGDEIMVRLNGITVNRVTGVWPTEGRILLQCEGAEIHFRHLKLTPLETAEKKGRNDEPGRTRG